MYLKVYPVIAEFHDFQITYFGIISGLILLLIYHLLKRDLQKSQLELTTNGLINIIIFTVFGAIAGARIGFILTHLSFYFSPSTPALELLAVWRGGLSFWGGFLGGSFTLFMCCEFKELSFMRFTDLFAPYLFLVHTLGRLGNFLNGESFGTPTQLPWGVMFRYGPASERYFGIAIHPTMLYEGVLCLVGFILLYAIRKLHLKKGFLICSYVLLYSSIRFFVSFFRADEYKFLGYTITHFIAIFGISLSLAVIFGMRLFEEDHESGAKQYKPTRQWNI